MSRLLVLSLFGIIFMFGGCTTPENKIPATLILVRHAEKATEPAQDPPLTDRGQARARKLAQMLSQQSVGAVYSTPFQRTRLTVTPLSDNQGIEITEYDPRDETGVFLESIIASHPGQVVVICGHSNTIPAMLNYLSGTEDWSQLDESDYNDLFLVNATIGEKSSVTHLTYPE